MSKKEENFNPLSAEEEDTMIASAMKNFRGNMSSLQQAIGMYYVGKELGWRVMYLAHDRKTVNKAQKILDIDFREVLPEEGEQAHRSIAWKASQKVTNFWKAVKGEIKGIKSTEIK